MTTSPASASPGKIGLFGGHCEGSETFLECVVREVHEETGVRLAPERFEYLTGYSNVDADGGTVSGQLYVARGVPSDELTITEGSLLIADLGDLPRLKKRLAPAAMAAMRAFLAHSTPRARSDESYIIDLCDRLLSSSALRQHRFAFLTGDPGKRGVCRQLPVDAYYPALRLAVEYRERQHSEPVPFMDRRQTVSG